MATASGKKDSVEVAGGKNIQLGFVEKSAPWKLISRFFPSKVGGRPAWLDLKNLPDADTMKCGHCAAPYVFLCQIYAPDEDNAACFHRTIFMFICKSGACSQQPAGGVLALRSQLPLENAYYPAAPLDETPVVGADQYSGAHHGRLCAVCGCRGAKQCAGCKKVHYCGRHHQTADWKHGHRRTCAESGEPGAGSDQFLLPEAELVIEEEPADAKGAAKSEEQRLADFEALKLQGNLESMPNADVDELDKMAVDGDDVFARFRKRVAREPEQVVRYWRGGAPLWVSDRHAAAAGDVPACGGCGAPRSFEFQVLPQLLNHLDLDEMGDSVDWGTLAVYTCSADCAPNGYAAEFVWRQQM